MSFHIFRVAEASTANITLVGSLLIPIMCGCVMPKALLAFRSTRLGLAENVHQVGLSLEPLRATWFLTTERAS